MEEKFVKHKTWFEAEVDGEIYKCIFLSRGFSFSTLRVKKLIRYRERKKYLLFGPIVKVPVYEIVTYSHRDDDINTIITMKKFYNSIGVKNLIRDIIKQIPQTEHSYKI